MFRVIICFVLCYQRLNNSRANIQLLAISSYFYITFALKQGLSLNQMLNLSDRLAELFRSLVFVLPVMGPQAHKTMAGLLHGCWEFNLRSLCLFLLTELSPQTRELKDCFFLNYYYFFIRFIHFMCGCFACIYVCAPCVCLVPKEDKRGQDSLELQLLMIVRCCLGC